jgi:hypothetical protein
MVELAQVAAVAGIGLAAVPVVVEVVNPAAVEPGAAAGPAAAFVLDA